MKKSLFQKLRKPDSNRSPLFYIFSAIIFGMIIVTFVFMSPNGSGNLSGSATAATVGGRVIPILQLQQRTQQIEEQNKMFLPNAGDQFQKFFQAQALNDLINAELLTEVEPQEELYVSDSLLAQTIMEIPAFQEKGQFKRDLYETYLLNSGSSANSLEDKIKKDLRIGLVRELFNDAFLTTKIEKSVYEKITDFDIKMEFVDVSEVELALKSSQVKVTDDEIKTNLENPEFLKKAKAEFDRTSFKYLSKEKVKAKWILALAPDLSEAAFDKAKEKVKALDLNNKNFAEMAKLHSEDPTAEQGGDLGYVEKGTFDEAWDKAAFSTSAGQISELFKTPQGWAKVLVEEKKPASQSAFEDVKFMVAKDVLSQDKTKAVLSEIKMALGQGPDSLNKVLKDYGLSWKSATDFKMSADQIPGFSKNDDLFEKLLSLKSDGAVYSDILSDSGKSYIIKRKSFNTAKANPADYQNMTGQRQNYALGNWFSAQKETVRIKVNPLVETNTNLF